MKTKLLLIAALLLVTVPAGWAKRDPLNAKEIDELREAAQDPPQRFKLLVGFAQARLATIEQLRSDTRFSADRGQRIHDLLEDFTTLVDEIDDNIDDYADKKTDLRKPLKVVIEATSDFQLKLRSIKETADPALAKEAKDYQMVLLNAIDAVNSVADNARKLLDEQNATLPAMKKEKEKREKR